MSVLFADVFEAIRAIRVCKGTTEKDIMNYVQDKVGGCLSVKNVLKTIRTLNKLVEEGLLVKKGKRYLFPANPPGGKNPCEEEDEESILDDEEDDDDDNCCDKKESTICNKCEDDDDDDDDENDNDNDNNICDDENDDEDDDCDEDEENGKDECDDEMEERDDEDSLKEDSSNTDTVKENSYDKSSPGKGRSCGSTSEMNLKKSHSKVNPKKKDSKKEIAKCVSGTGSDNKSPGGGRRESNLKTSYRTGEVEQFARLFVAKNRGSKELRNSVSKRSRLTNGYRSRSPIRRAKADMYHVLNLDKTGIMGPNPIQSQIFEEAVDAEMELDGLNSTEYNLIRRASSIVTSQPNLSRPLGEKSGSSTCNFDKKILCDTVKEEPLQDEPVLKSEPESKASIFKPRTFPTKRPFKKSSSVQSKEKFKKENSPDSKNMDNKNDNVSLCSVCEKKRKNS